MKTPCANWILRHDLLLPDGAGRVLVSGLDPEDACVCQNRVRYGHQVYVHARVLENELGSVVVQISNLNVHLCDNKPVLM